jgi:hypothetical protein
MTHIHPADKKVCDFWNQQMRGAVSSPVLASGCTLFTYADGSQKVCGCSRANGFSADMFVRDPTPEEIIEVEEIEA